MSQILPISPCWPLPHNLSPNSPLPLPQVYPSFGNRFLNCAFFSLSFLGKSLVWDIGRGICTAPQAHSFRKSTPERDFSPPSPFLHSLHWEDAFALGLQAARAVWIRTPVFNLEPKLQMGKKALAPRPSPHTPRSQWGEGGLEQGQSSHKP